MDEQVDLVFDLLAEPVLSEFQPDDWTVWQEMTLLRNENYAFRQCMSEVLRLAQLHTHTPDALREEVHARLLVLRTHLMRSGRLGDVPELPAAPSAQR
jgi:hypothetical protein